MSLFNLPGVVIFALLGSVTDGSAQSQHNLKPNVQIESSVQLAQTDLFPQHKPAASKQTVGSERKISHNFA